MKIAVIGAGLAGLALSYNLLKEDPSIKLTIFDPIKADQRTSSLAHLLYPYVGMRSKLNWKGHEAFESSHALLQEIQKFTKFPLFRETKILKLASDIRQQKAYQQAAQDSPLLLWKEQTVYGSPALMIDILQVNAPLYLTALQKACCQQGALFSPQTFNNHLHEYDQIVLACGAQTSSYLPQKDFSKLKGQILTLRWPSSSFELPYSLVGNKLHLTPSIDDSLLYVGNTYEREFHNPLPDKQKAISLLWPQLNTLFPDLSPSDVLSVHSGVRLNAPNRLPLLGKTSSKSWVFTALGSKGLLYHSYLAKQLAQAIIQNCESHIAHKVRLNKN